MKLCLATLIPCDNPLNVIDHRNRRDLVDIQCGLDGVAQPEPAKIKRVTFEWFRDSGTNAASKRGVDTDKVRMWLGHRRGELDKYDPRHPPKTQPVVDAIYAKYFDGETVQNV